MDWLRRIVEDPRTDQAVMALIVLNAITLGIETSHTAMERFGPAERDIVHGETEPLAGELRQLRAEIVALRRELIGRIDGRPN